LGVETILKILTYLAAGIAFSSVAPFIGISFLAAFVLLFCLALVADFRNTMILPRVVLNVIATIAVVLSILRIEGVNIILPGLETLSLLLSLKLLEKKEPRDYLQIYLLAILLLAGSSLLSLDMIFLAYMGAFVLLLGMAAIFVSCLAEETSLRLPFAVIADIGRQSLLMTLIVIPISGLLFFVLPRTSYPFFSFLNRGAVAKSGFSDSVRLGKISQIQLDEAVVMRVAMEQIEERSLYWRGIVFDHFNGQAWQVKEQKEGPLQRYGSGGRPLRYTVYLEPYEFNTIMTLDHPVYVMLRQVRRYDSYTYTATFPLNKKISYESISNPQGVIHVVEDDLSRYLEAPPEMPRVKVLAAEIAAGREGAAAAGNILRHLRRGRYAYALKNLPASGRPLEDFLFTYRYGNCEYFASAMAVMLRYHEIPSRLVGGYRGGYYHDYGKYYVVPQRFAHVWVEAYFPGQGWVRFDPTPATAADVASLTGTGAMFRVRMVFDIMEYYWNMTIINYDLQKQMRLFVTLPALLKPPSLKFAMQNIIWFIAVPLGLLLLAAVWFVFPRVAIKSRERRVLEAFLRQMARRGYQKRAHEGLEEFVRSLPEGPLKEAAHKFVEQYQWFYYKDRPLSRRDEGNLRLMIRGL
jgi:protein-glutamine gamma-glutamyltransferase